MHHTFKAPRIISILIMIISNSSPVQFSSVLLMEFFLYEQNTYTYIYIFYRYVPAIVIHIHTLVGRQFFAEYSEKIINLLCTIYKNKRHMCVDHRIKQLLALNEPLQLTIISCSILHTTIFYI